jgi:hypothetical protein
MQLTDRLLVKVVLLFIGLTKISEAKSCFDHPSVIDSVFVICLLWEGGEGDVREKIEGQQFTRGSKIPK